MEQLRQIVAILRSEQGCPWDREQTHQSLRGGLLEEAYEVVAAIDAADDENLGEELGDLLLQVVFHSQIAQETERFDLDAVALGITQKLVRRHPHVFAQESAADSAAVLTRWEEIKRAEKGLGAAAEGSVLDGISEGLPALLHALKVQKRAAQVGMDWGALAPVLEKVREELAEVEQSVGGAEGEVEAELGDLLFSVVNVCRKLKVDPEVALRGASGKFARRLRGVEKRAAQEGVAMREQPLEVLDGWWNEVKAREAGREGNA
jgi:MazG family protein